MTLSTQLKSAALYTGLDSVKELLERAARKIDQSDSALSWVIQQHDEGKFVTGRSIDVARAALASQGEQL
ncbi:hypothetical protein PSQ40_04690 [Curvibacter sp. HBC61]|uniref:CopG family transcriptional regulator n=1 Tax=Curvibacter cyanobacteriorum TaxID=3026422 RepID=A0ABT5MYK3_9BURK|nr:hypothetical protein [Curvibacter sp. HBC61]MDD0837862.1 hypothetical protein [Curvibacter sp. HBC61]